MFVKTSRKRNVRIRQVLRASLLALVVWLGNFLLPLDELAWTVQARVVDVEPSGKLVFVGSDEDLADTDFPNRRAKLAEAVIHLREIGVDRIYIDEVFEERGSKADDENLNVALRSMGGRAYLINTLEPDTDGKLHLNSSVKSVSSGVPIVGSDLQRFASFIVWNVPSTIEYDGQKLENVALSLSDKGNQQHISAIPIYYGFAKSKIPSYSLAEITENRLSPGDRNVLQNARVVIGNYHAKRTINIPGSFDVPAAMVHIYAAETLIANPLVISEIVPPLLILAVLMLAAVSRSSRQRLILYILAGLIPVAALIIATVIGSRIGVGTSLALCLAYGACRLRLKWMENLQRSDKATGLATFAALEAEQWSGDAVPSIVVAKVHRFEDVRKTLPPELHAEYTLQIAERLKAVSPDLEVYLGPAHLLAWCVSEPDQSLLIAHLEGLRALFTAPLRVGDKQVDVALTFGVDNSYGRDVPARLANAVSAAERTNETSEPILVEEFDSDEDLLWNISLQARIDNALAKGEIYLNYQPKVLLATGEMIGVEALVRWHDPVKGMIPPDSFIRQCEHTGRMNHVTRHVLNQACMAGNHLFAHNRSIAVAANISATMLHDRRVVGMVKEVLTQTGFDPNFLTLEITETYRIKDFALAAEILEELKAVGIKLSMDDFGVGAASMEALLNLPFSELKIDRLFVSQMVTNPKARGIVQSILQLGRQLNAIVVAEGVEDQRTLALLRESGCAIAQGYGILKPASLDKIVLFRDTYSKKTALTVR